SPAYQFSDLPSAVGAQMAAVAELYQRFIYKQQASRDFLPASGDFQLRSRLESAILDPSHPELVQRLAEDAPDLWRVLHDEVLTAAGKKTLLRFLGAAYGSSERYSLIVRHQQAIVRSLELFQSSAFLVEILVRNQKEIQTLADLSPSAPAGGNGILFDFLPVLFGEDQFPGADAVFAYIASSNSAGTDKIALLRQHFRHRMFAAGARDLAGFRPVYSSFAETTSAAESAIGAAFGIAASPRGLSILALGRLGSREFDLVSDADLLFVCDPAEDRLALTRSAEQIMQALAAYTQDGMAFPVDARLRPRGAEGELLVTPQQLESYFSSEAQPWEA